MQAKDNQGFNSKVSNRKDLLAKAQLGKCTLCDSKDKHKEGDCLVLLAADINQRWELVKLKKVCFGCLLHVTPIPPISEQDSKGVHCALHNTQVNMTRSCMVALKIVVVPFVNSAREIVRGTVLLDSGSETTLIREGFANQLGVSGRRPNLTVDAVGGVKTILKSQRVRLPFAPAVTKVGTYAMTMKNVCEPVHSVNWTEIKKQYDHLRDIPVDSVGEMNIDVLLGLDAAFLMAH